MAADYPDVYVKNAFVYGKHEWADWILSNDYDSQVLVPPNTPGANGTPLGTIWKALKQTEPLEKSEIPADQFKDQSDDAEPSFVEPPSKKPKIENPNDHSNQD